MRRATRGVTVVAAAVLAFAGLPTVAANAAAGEQCTYTEDNWDHTTAYGCFRADGDHIITIDGFADGHRAVTHWETDYGPFGECDNTTGAGSLVDCNYDWAESGHVKIKVCVQEGSVHIDCTPWTSWISISTGKI